MNTIAFDVIFKLPLQEGLDCNETLIAFLRELYKLYGAKEIFETFGAELTERNKQYE